MLHLLRLPGPECVPGTQFGCFLGPGIIWSAGWQPAFRVGPTHLAKTGAF